MKLKKAIGAVLAAACAVSVLAGCGGQCGCNIGRGEHRGGYRGRQQPPGHYDERTLPQYVHVL